MTVLKMQVWPKRRQVSKNYISVFQNFLRFDVGLPGICSFKDDRRNKQEHISYSESDVFIIKVKTVAVDGMKAYWGSVGMVPLILNLLCV